MTFEEQLQRQVDAAATRQTLKPGRAWLPSARALAPAGLAAVVVAGVVFAFAAGGREHERVAEPAQQQSASSQLADEFSILREPVSTSDALPDVWQRQIRTVPTASGAQIERAHRVDVGSDSGSVWVIPAESRACLAHAQSGAFAISCFDEATLRSGAFSTGSGSALQVKPDEVRVLGLLPDDATDPVIVGPSGSRQSVPLRSNVYSAVAPKRGARLEWTGADGKPRSQEIDNPF